MTSVAPKPQSPVSPLVESSEPRPPRWGQPETQPLLNLGYPFTKRLFDIVCSGLGLVVLAPVGFLLGLALKLAYRGPVFYSQMRVGQFGKPFRIWKFRSMVDNADQVGAPLTSQDDPRITRIGGFLRKTKLDELPQLWNVLRGAMSLVGPRPEVSRYVDLYTPEQREILQYKPGITDVASLLFRNEEELLRGSDDLEGFYLRYCLPRKIELNRQYAQRATLLRDVGVILQTLFPYWLAALVVYTACLVAGFWLSYQLRSDFQINGRDYNQFWGFLPLFVLPQLMLLVWQGQLRGLLSYFSIPEMRKTVLALGLALVPQVGLCYLLHAQGGPARTIFLMDFILSFFILCAVRMGLRLFRERVSRSRRASQVPPRRVAIIGTGELATNLLLDFARSENPVRRVVAFFDDDPHKWHKRPHDVPVVGMPECLLKREWFEQLDEVIVTLPEENSARIRELGEMLKPLPLRVTIASGWPAVKVPQI